MDITEIINALIKLIVALASVYLIPFIKQKASASKLEKLIKLADVGVAAAQQLFTAEQWAEKKKYVQEFLQKKGYNVDLPEVDTVIEASVKRVKKELGN